MATRVATRITVVLDPFNDAANPQVTHVLYAAHDTSVWVTGNAIPKALERPQVWVARGTHASYQFPSTEEEDCHQPQGSSFPNVAAHFAMTLHRLTSNDVGTKERLRRSRKRREIR